MAQRHRLTTGTADRTLPLSGRRLTLPGSGAAAWHAARMLRWLGATVDSDAVADDASAAADWAVSGALALTGRSDGPPLLPPGQAASAVRGALLAIETLTATRMPGPELLGERAAIAGLRRNAPRSAGGAFRVLRAADGWVGVNLARPSDRELVPAWLAEPDPVLDEAVAVRSVQELIDQGRLVGLPVAGLSEPDTKPVPFVLTGRAGEPSPWSPPLVVDLSALWAGPLCGHLLTLLGARVVKVESTHRPDGTRFGPRQFHDLLHAGQESVALDFTSTAGRAALAGLVDAADVVIEASRPRALAQLGIDVKEVLARAGPKVWVSITAYGRTGRWSNAVGFGDDTAMAAGLLAVDPDTGTPAPCGDAIGDPVTGVNATLVAVACRLAGGTWLADLAMRDQVAATMVGMPGPAPAALPPVARRPTGAAPDLGADTARVLTELGLPC
ncbi:MAG TPA: CoA transferase [Pseudonocardiaceae bacterium]|nr:CoA transferase [Pseudonocardiaceae bacterium]